MKKMISVIAIVALLTATMLCVGAVSAATGPFQPGPPEDAGDCIPGITPIDAPGTGPAPNAGLGLHDGPGW